MNIVVTGAVGIGKTTLCHKVASLSKSLGFICGGVLSYKAPDGGVMVVDVRTGRMERLAGPGDIYGGPRMGRFSFSPEGIRFGNNAIVKGGSCHVLFIDEIGPLELAGMGFTKAFEVFKKGEAGRTVTVVRKELLPAFIARLGQPPVVLETTSHNRNELPQRVCALLLGEAEGKRAVQAPLRPAKAYGVRLVDMTA